MPNLKQVSLDTITNFLTDWKSKPAEVQWAVLGAVQMAMLMSKPATADNKKSA